MKILKRIFTDEFCERTEPKMTRFLNNGGMKIVFAIAFFGIFLAIVGHYGKDKFIWELFVFFELPLYAFLCWALFKVLRIWKNKDQ